jgi:hypothetical protein
MARPLGGRFARDLARARQAGVISKHCGPERGCTARIRSEQVAESDFPVSQGESDFLGI